MENELEIALAFPYWENLEEMIEELRSYENELREKGANKVTIYCTIEEAWGVCEGDPPISALIIKGEV